MVKRQIKFTFPSELVTKPLTYNLSQDFRIVTNSRRADIAKQLPKEVLESLASPAK